MLLNWWQAIIFNIRFASCFIDKSHRSGLLNGGGSEEKKGYARVIQGLDGVLDSLGTEGERAIRKSGRARDTLESRYPFQLLTLSISTCERVFWYMREARHAPSKRERCDMRPPAKILFLITLRLSARSRSTAAALAPADPPRRPSISSSCVHVFSTAASMSVTAQHW